MTPGSPNHGTDGLVGSRDAKGRFTSHQGWTRSDALAAVREFARRTGYQPVVSEGGRWNDLPSWSTAQRLFGSWNSMIEAAGFTPYPAKNSGLAKVLAYRDRNPDWRQTLSDKKKRQVLLRHIAVTEGVE